MLRNNANLILIDFRFFIIVFAETMKYCFRVRVCLHSVRQMKGRLGRQPSIECVKALFDI